MAKMKKYLTDLARIIERNLELIYGQEMGFAIICFEFGKPGIADYISNAKREDMIKALKETLFRWEHNQDERR